MEREIRQRLQWVKLYEETGDAGYTCRRCGISRPTLRKWWRRYQADGLDGLKSLSRRPHTSPSRRISLQQRDWILQLRKERKLGVRQIKTELWRLCGFNTSLATIHKVLKRAEATPLERTRRRKTARRYQRDIPGERVQLDTCKIRPGMYLYTAIDDCTRCLAAAIYPRRNSSNSVDLLENHVSYFIFKVQRIQTDRGTEFTGMKVIDWLESNFVKWRPIPPRSPHLNGKVERVQRTILDEFFATIDLDSLSFEEIQEELVDWVEEYNLDRIHGSLGQPTMWKVLDLLDVCPDRWQIRLAYNGEYEARRKGLIGVDGEGRLLTLLRNSLK